MPKLHITTSPFLSPIMTLAKDVHWVRIYAAEKLLGMDRMQFCAYVKRFRVPYFYDGERELYLVDHRQGDEGEGGKYYSTNSMGKPTFPGWKGHMITPPKKLQSLPVRNPAKEALKAMGLWDENFDA